MSKSELLDQMYGHLTGNKMFDKKTYHCVSCGYELEQFTSINPMKATKKFFWCERKPCQRFGIVTVVAKVKDK